MIIVCTKAAVMLTINENHRTETLYEDYLIVKLFVFQVRLNNKLGFVLATTWYCCDMKYFSSSFYKNIVTCMTERLRIIIQLK